MTNILIAGAGKSSIYLIKFMLGNAHKNKWNIIVADTDAPTIADKIGGSKYGEAAIMDINNEKQRQALVKRAEIVISLMPPQFHILLAKDCLQFKKNFVFASYVSDEMRELEPQVKEAGLVFMGELGLDPGIDHMTASKIIHGIRRVSGKILSFKSYCGGLISPVSDNNPWHYKFTWNPKNVVTAGFGGAKYLSNGKNIEVPYEQMFDNNKRIKVGDNSMYAFYPNRDSSRYLSIYDIPEIRTFMRATLRHPQFCKGWNAMLQLGLTKQDDHFDTIGHTLISWVRKSSGCPDKVAIAKFVSDLLRIPENDRVISMLKWLGLFEKTPLKAGRYASADILLDVLLDKWKMAPEDKDLVVMSHEIDYIYKDKKSTLSSYMIVEGEDMEHSAMAKTVGLPLGIFSKLLLNNKITIPAGIHIPVSPAVYRPVLTELTHHGIIFTDVVE